MNAEELLKENMELRAKLAAHVPCQACAWAQPRPPAESEEPPIVRHALDAEAGVDDRVFAARRDTARAAASYVRQVAPAVCAALRLLEGEAASERVVELLEGIADRIEDAAHGGRLGQVTPWDKSLGQWNTTMREALAWLRGRTPNDGAQVTLRVGADGLLRSLCVTCEPAAVAAEGKA